MRDRVVHHGGPAEDEDHSGQQPASLRGGTEQDGGHKGGKAHLVPRKDDLGEFVVRLGYRALEDASEADILPVAVEDAAGRAEDERVADEHPLDGDDCERQHGEDEEGEGIFPSRQTGVEVSKTGNLAVSE